MDPQTPEDFCRAALPEVSRTFALNIPVLPEPLDHVVTVAYLLCRIADTVEDESIAPPSARAELFAGFERLVELGPGWRGQVARFVDGTVATLGAQAPEAEVRLLRGTGEVLAALEGLPGWTHAPIATCVRTMTRGMSEVSRALGGEKPQGLDDVPATLRYCYFVAGTVGEMLTSLFIAWSPKVAEKAAVLEPRAVAFGRALQLTNILKDIREDLERGYCWLPRDRMAAHGVSAANLLEADKRGQAVALLDELVGVARGELAPAFEYSLALPAEQPGLRLFCLWPLFFAALTLETLEHNAAVFEPAPVKISREQVGKVIAATQEQVADDAALRALWAEVAG